MNVTGLFSWKRFTKSMADKKTARQNAEEISKQQREPEHLGKYSPEALQQELFSLINTKPAFRDKRWNQKWERINHIIDDIKDERVKRRLKGKAKDMLAGEG